MEENTLPGISAKLVDNEMNEFVSRKPHWVIRKGNGIFLMIFLLVIGIISFLPQQNYINVHSSLVLNDHLAAGNKKYDIKFIIPQDEITNVFINQPVLLSFDAFPDEKFGKIMSKIKYISNVPTAEGFMAYADFNTGPINNTGIIFNEKLKIKGQIVLKRTSIYENIFN